MSELKILLAFDNWANQRVISRLSEVEEPESRALQLLAHILTSQKIWILRIKGQDSGGIDKMPNLSLEQCRSLARENLAALSTILDRFVPDGLNTPITYENLSGKQFTNLAKDILTHVVTHGTYHRGQIASALRAAGLTPVDTDFITFVREQ